MQKVMKVFVHTRELFLSAEFRMWRRRLGVVRPLHSYASKPLWMLSGGLLQARGSLPAPNVGVKNCILCTFYCHSLRIYTSLIWCCHGKGQPFSLGSCSCFQMLPSLGPVKVFVQPQHELGWVTILG